MRIPYGCSIVVALALALPAARASALANLTVDGAQRFQRIAGMGVNVNVNSWSAGALAPALDLLVGPAGSAGAATTVRVIRDPMDWVADEADIPLLRDRDSTTLARIYEAPAMRDLWSTIAYLNSKGVGGEHIILNFMGWTPTWLGGGGAYNLPSYLTPGKEPEFATMLASLVYYGRVVKGLDFKLLAPVNEMDWNCLEGPCMDAGQYVTMLRALSAELDSLGVADVRLVGPDAALESNAGGYIAGMMADGTIAGRVDHLCLHRYGSAASPGVAYAAQDFWLTETGASCPNCDTGGAPAQGEWAFATQSVDIVLGSLLNGLSLACYYDGYDSFYYHHDHFDSWGLLAYDQGTGRYTPRKRFYADAQINGFIRPGAVRIAQTNTISGLGPTVALFDSATGAIAIVGRNTTASSLAISGQLDSLPAVASLAAYETDNAGLNLTRGADVAVTNGSFAVTIPPNAVFSLVGYPSSDTAGTPPVAVATAAPTTGAAPLAVSFSGAGSFDGDGDSLSYAWNFGDGGTATGRLASHIYTFGGDYAALLTVGDGHGNADTASVAISVVTPRSFPQSPVLDGFNRADGALAAPWVDQIAACSIASDALAPGGAAASIEWDGATFGANQEAYVTLSAITASAPEQNLMLKTQGTTWSAGHLEVSYSAPYSRVTVATYTPSAWKTWGTLNSVSFAPGDRFGARAYGDGTVQVYRNDAPIGSVSVAGWAFAGSGGRIGLSCSGAASTRFDNFGGGTVTSGVTAVEPPSPVGARVSLSGAFPNPTGRGAEFSLALPEEADVSLRILDVQGRLVWSAPVRRYAAGRWSLSWDGRAASGPAVAGVYLARVRVGGRLFSRSISVRR